MEDGRQPVGLNPLFDKPEEWLSTYQQRRREIEALMEAHRKRRDELAQAQKKELDDLLSSCAHEMEAPSAALVEVAPIRKQDIEAIPRRRAAYSDRMAALLSKLALLAYIRFEDPDRKQVLDAALTEGGLKLVAGIAVDDTECVVVDAGDFLVVAFRGTTSERDRKTDFQINVDRVVVENHPEKVRVHAGFYAAYQLVEQKLHEAIQSVDYKTVYLTGHSLGGAVALVASAAMGGSDALGKRVAAVYTFGAPRVGGRDFPRIVKAPHYRIVNSGDVVPTIPPSWLNGYVHTGEPYLLQGKGMKPVRKRPAGSVIWLALWSLLLWPFSRGLLVLKNHDIALYAARLDRIARARGRWS